MIKHKLLKYKIFKDSEVDWIEKVPAHWKLKHFKQISTMKGRIGWQGLKFAEFIDEGPFLITGMNFNNGKIHWDDVYHISNERYNQAPEIQLKEHDVLMTKDGTIGKLLYVENIPFPHKASLNSHLLVLRPIKNSYDPRYIFYQLDSAMFKYYVDIVKKGTTFFGISQASVGKYIAVCPPIEEQKEIAYYLDTKTAQIDQEIDLLTQKATKYKELKQSLINDTVTQGLDKTVVMKDSGVEWIGKIPKHWKIKRLKDLGYLYSGLSNKTSDDFTNEHEYCCDFIPFTNIANNLYISEYNMKKVIVFPNEVQNKVKKYDLFFLMSSENYEDIGKSALLKYDAGNTYLNSFCKGFRFTDKSIFSGFMNYLFLSTNYRNAISVEGKGFTRINLKIEKIKNRIVLVLPYEEQKAIAEYLDTKTAQIDNIIDTINIQIEKIKELRKTLINDVVTGKIKVVEGDNI